MRIHLLAVALLSFAAGANDTIGVPIGGAVDLAPDQAQARVPDRFVIEGPFDGIFRVFDRYEAHVIVDTGVLFKAEAEKLYDSFEACAGETRRVWKQLAQHFGRPQQDENQVWWFDAGNRQRISLDCTIYGSSGKIAMNMVVVDSALASQARQAREDETRDRLQQ